MGVLVKGLSASAP